MNLRQPEKTWKSWQKIGFRFFFVLLTLLSVFAYNPVMQVLGMRFIQQAEYFTPLKGIVAWLDNHIFHLGYLPKEHLIYFSNTHFGVILTLTILVIAFIATALWTKLDTKRPGYNRLYYWFCNYLAYYLFLAMISYAIIKIIPVQATYPTAPELLARWGTLRNWEVLFRFMGTSPAYCMFCGWFELIACVLILFNRTRVIGGLLMFIALVQIVILNLSYNNNVSLLSAILLLATIFIIARAIPKLYTIFIRLKPVSFAEYQYTFSTPWKKYVMILLCFLPLWKCIMVTNRSWTRYNNYARNEQLQRLYNVSVYQRANDTLPPLTTDTTRWKYVCFLDFSPNNKQLVKFDMQENITRYQCNWGNTDSTITSTDTAANKNIFSYSTLPNGDMQLKGNWNGENITMQLTTIPIDSMTLIKDKFLFMQEDQ